MERYHHQFYSVVVTLFGCWKEKSAAAAAEGRPGTIATESQIIVRS
jgi:hypothetical protein